MGKKDKPKPPPPDTDQPVIVQAPDDGVEQTDAHLEGHGIHD